MYAIKQRISSANEVEFRYKLSSGTEIYVCASGKIIPGLNGSYDFPPESPQITQLHIDPYTWPELDPLPPELAMQVAGEWEWIEGKAVLLLVEDAGL